jgi:hypothetical protein
MGDRAIWANNVKHARRIAEATHPRDLPRILDSCTQRL